MKACSSPERSRSSSGASGSGGAACSAEFLAVVISGNSRRFGRQSRRFGRQSRRFGGQSRRSGGHSLRSGDTASGSGTRPACRAYRCRSRHSARLAGQAEGPWCWLSGRDRSRSPERATGPRRAAARPPAPRPEFSRSDTNRQLCLRRRPRRALSRCRPWSVRPPGSQQIRRRCQLRRSRRTGTARQAKLQSRRCQHRC